jgi:predicted enzyme related to lactoylglutathione lyase
MTTPITVQGIYACMHVADWDGGLSFYTKLMGRGPDDQPFDGMAQWRNMGAAGLQLWHDPDRAGHSRTTIVVPVMATERSRLDAASIALGEDIAGDWGVVAQLTDPEGNQITLAEPPKDFAG